MKKMLFAFTVLSAMLVASSAFAQADWADKNGSLGVGVDRNVSGGGFSHGLSLRFYPAETFGLEAIIGGGMQSTSSSPDAGGDSSTSRRRFDISLLGEVSVLRSRQAVLSGYLGLGFGLIGVSADPGDSASYTDFAAELGLRGEVWLYEFFSIHGRVGINIDPVGDKEGDGFPTEDDTTDNGGMNIGIFNGDAVGMFGFTFWLN